jgi:hypothetical protein
MKIKQGRRRQKIESNGDWLLRRPRLTQDCSSEGTDGITQWMTKVINFYV